MKKCYTIEDGVRAAEEVYRYSFDTDWKYVPAEDGELVDKLILNGEEYPFFWWRTDTQITSMRGMAAPRKLCSMKLNRSCPKSEGLERLMYRELDIAEQMLGSEISKIMCFRNGSAANMIGTTESERVAIFELAAVLNDETAEQGRHTYWGEDGMASDRVVSQKLASEAVYLFTEDKAEPETYNDIFIYMYGLSKNDVVKAAAIVGILKGTVDISDWKAKDAHYRECIKAAAESATSGRRIEVKKGE